MNPRATIAAHPVGLAFNSLAERYDEIFTRSPIGKAQREAVWRILDDAFRPGDSILELNCGTGEDALFLSRKGISVLACDASEAMISVAQHRRANEAPLSPVEFEVLPIEHLGSLRPERLFDGIFSNFSGLNCVQDLTQVARDLASLTKLGAPALLCLSSRFCLWEVAWFLLNGNLSKAFRRWKGRSRAVLGGVAIEVHYPTIRALRQFFDPWFRICSITGIGISVPPSYLGNWINPHPTLLRCMSQIDDAIRSWPGVRIIGDHVLLWLERTAA